MRDPIPEFMNYNRAFARRNPELLRLKVARMAESPFAFFRGTIHLFARDVISKIFESVPLRLDFEVRRLATSLFLAARDGGQSVQDAVHVMLVGLSTYTDTVRRVLGPAPTPGPPAGASGRRTRWPS